MVYETKEELEKGNYTELKSYPNIEEYAHHGRASHVEQVIHCIKVSTTRIPLYRKDSAITRHSCAFWETENSCYYVEEFADI